MSDDARRRGQALIGAFAGVVVVIAAVVALAVAGDSADETAGNRAAAQPAATTPAPAATTPGAEPPATQAPADPGFPPLPAGADPALASKPTTTAGTGELTELTVTPLVRGEGAAAREGQAITVNYVGVRYQTGEEFDASWTRSQPFSFQLGAGNVIPGFEQGLIGVTVGSRVQIDVPADLAYGDNPSQGSRAGPLRFVVDVLAVQ